jgi:hypothetical protein
VQKINPDGTKTLYIGKMHEVNKNSGGTVTNTDPLRPAGRDTSPKSDRQR